MSALIFESILIIERSSARLERNLLTLESTQTLKAIAITRTREQRLINVARSNFESPSIRERNSVAHDLESIRSGRRTLRLVNSSLLIRTFISILSRQITHVTNIDCLQPIIMAAASAIPAPAPLPPRRSHRRTALDLQSR